MARPPGGDVKGAADQHPQHAFKDVRTLFVRGIATHVDETTLSESFSALGPISQCFIVRDKGQEGHKGFGFVQFALPEDAERAAAELHGTCLGGRRLKVEVANKRAPLEDRKKRKRGAALDISADTAAAVASKTAEAPTCANKPDLKTPAAPLAAATAVLPAPKRQKAARAGPASFAVAGPVSHPASAAEQKHRLARAVALGNVTQEVAASALGLAKAVGQVDDVMSPAPEELVERYKLRADGCTGAIVIIVYHTVKDAMHAVSQLHGALVHPAAPKPLQRKGKGKSAVEPAEPALPLASSGVTLWARQVSGEGAHVKKWRIILRNLPFTVTETQVRSLLSAAGFIWELKLPRGPDGSPRGFAFAAFTCRAHAERAIQLTNGKLVGKRAVAVDWAVAKAQFESGKAADPGVKDQNRTPDGAPSDDSGGEGSGSQDDSASSDDNPDEEGEEELAYGGDEDEQEMSAAESDGGSGCALEAEADNAEAARLAGPSKHPSRAPAVSVDDGDADADAAARERSMLRSVLAGVLAEEGEVAPAQPVAKAVKKAQPAMPVPAATVTRDKGAFVGASEPAVGAAACIGSAATKQAPRSADHASAPKVLPPTTSVLGGTTGTVPGPAHSVGPLACTVFVRNLPLDCQPLDLQLRMENYGPVKACRFVMNKSAGKQKGTAFVEYKTEEGARKAAEACARGRRGEGPGVVLSGGPLVVDLAVDKDKARDLAAVNFGFAPGTGPFSKTGDGKKTPADKRNLYLAKEGEVPEDSLAWRGMSEHDRQKRKRASAEKATKLKSPNFSVSATRLSVRNLPPSLGEKALAALFVRAVKERATQARPQVKQAKILREEQRVGEDGRPRSKGMGFIEFDNAEHALVALRQLNNNPNAFAPDKRPIVEFALENVKMIKAREARQAQQAAILTKTKAEAAGPDGAGEDGAQKGDGRLAKKRSRADAGGAGAAAGAKIPRRDGTGSALGLKTCMYWDGSANSCRRGDACLYSASHILGKPTQAFRDAAAGASPAAAATRKGPSKPTRAPRSKAARAASEAAAARATIAAVPARDSAPARKAIKLAGLQPGERPNPKRLQQRLARLQARQNHRGGKA